jgi:small-conductance mechanosensitive channel
MTIEKDPITMSDAELEKALAHDAERRKAIALNKEVAAAGAPTVPPERIRRVQRAQQLRDDLAGYATMTPDLRAVPAVKERLWPSIVEYTKLRLELATEATYLEMVGELRLTRDEVAAVMVAAMPSPGADLVRREELEAAKVEMDRWRESTIEAREEVSRLSRRVEQLHDELDDARSSQASSENVAVAAVQAAQAQTAAYAFASRPTSLRLGPDNRPLDPETPAPRDIHAELDALRDRLERLEVAERAHHVALANHVESLSAVLDMQARQLSKRISQLEPHPSPTFGHRSKTTGP